MASRRFSWQIIAAIAVGLGAAYLLGRQSAIPAADASTPPPRYALIVTGSAPVGL